ncbi:hypothetical protein XA68_17696 [Ophiocordyceps unilateralis]|uniref:ASX DEUBAD domain-containing protein n=1 Tax=Ophiocordyceps unilateralis TaxID=268505 RepID=A0A2A9P2T4_OPHUN|nr:hypothetical protein XA68_17696 [Ophiocordyceps unilateralis]
MPASSPQHTPRTRPSRQRTAPTRRGRRNVARLIRSPKSPLAQADLRAILANPLAWTALDASSRAEILALFPDDKHILEANTTEARPAFQSLMSDDSFRYHCATYTANLALGRHDEEWLSDAWAAHERRKAGDFDEYLSNKFVEEWMLDGSEPQTPA